MTVKPYFTPKNLLIYAASTIFLSAVNGSVGMSLGIGVMLGTLFIGYPFAIGEKSNMDAMYATLSVNRKTVVLGRYLFALALNICTVAFAFVVATIGVFGAKVLNVSQNGGGETFPLVLAMTTLLIFIQAIQLPIFFKLGYTKAKFMSVIPFAFFMGLYAAFIGASKESGASGLSATLAGLLSDRVLTATLAALLLAAVVCVSYNLSVAFYRKREF
jgi:hypothetical protein